MSLWSRLNALFRIKASRALDRAEDPRQMLDYSYERQLDLLQEVRRGLAEGLPRGSASSYRRRRWSGAISTLPSRPARR